MNEPLYLSRARLRRDAPIAALAAVLIPDDADQRLGVAHRLLWTLFADHPDRERDFLWRADDEGRFMLLSRRPPDDPHRLFDLAVKPFEPALRAGDRLGFVLRANPVVSRQDEDGRVRRHDVVMDRLRAVPPGGRAAVRDRLALEAGQDWMRRQGERCGFTLDGAILVEGYTQVRVPREGQRPVTFSQLDIAGSLAVTDPERLVAAIAGGFGKSRGFGCGLMLVRRAG